MKKISLIVLFIVFYHAIYAQAAKDALYDKLHSPAFAWLTAVMIDNFTTVNMKEDAWNYATADGDTYGINIFNTLGTNIGAYFDFVNGTTLNRDCRFGNDNPDCKSKVDALKGTLSIEFNAMAMKFSPDHYKLAMRALNTVGKFFDNGNYGTKMGWRPRGKTLKIILNIDNGNGLPVVSWNNDGTVATIKMPVDTELSQWDETLLKGLEKGGKK